MTKTDTICLSSDLCDQGQSAADWRCNVRGHEGEDGQTAVRSHHPGCSKQQDCSSRDSEGMTTHFRLPLLKSIKIDSSFSTGRHACAWQCVGISEECAGQVLWRRREPQAETPGEAERGQETHAPSRICGHPSRCVPCPHQVMKWHQRVLSNGRRAAPCHEAGDCRYDLVNRGASEESNTHSKMVLSRFNLM